MITQSEIDAARAERRANYDSNGDSELNLQEFTGLWSEMTEPLKVRGFQFLDSDGNGKISKAEIDQRLAGIVKRFDRNCDGASSMEDRHHWHWSHDHNDDDDDDSKSPSPLPSLGRRFGAARFFIGLALAALPALLRLLS